MKNNNKSSQFWEYIDGKPKISHSGVINFIQENGFMRVRLLPTTTIIVRNNNNRIEESSIDQIISFCGGYLKYQKLTDVYEVFVKGIGSYISNPKLNFIKEVPLLNDRDDKFSSNFFYNNCYCKVTKDSINVLKYETLPFEIWEKRIMKRDYIPPNNSKEGQFEIFIKNITNKDDKRFKALKSIIGYLLHRNRDRGETVAVILYDEMMSLNNQANGGTGKTLLSQALNIFRDVETFDGKEIKTGSWFKNQRFNLTTDVVVYDDLNKEISLENFYSMITSGIEVEKKRKDAFYIPFEKSPKILITSNYPVKGPGGSSDKRRRHEFEIANHYDADFTPEMEFGNRFFNKYWGNVEWSKFFKFMMECVQEYLKYGLIKAEPINLGKAIVVNETSAEFFEYVSPFLDYNKWIDKRQFQKDYEELFPKAKKVSPHTFTKWVTKYVNEIGGKFETRSTGGEYYFMVEMKEVTNV